MSKAGIEEVEKELVNNSRNPRDIKADLAKNITGIYHGQTTAEEAAKEFDRVFKDKEQPSEIVEKIIEEKESPIDDLLLKC